LRQRVSVCESDLFSQVSGRFDLIISNPPYVDATDVADMPAEFHAEPMLGLAAGEDGLDLVRTMLQQAGAHLSERGWMVVEVGNSQPAMQAAFSQLPLTWLLSSVVSRYHPLCEIAHRLLCHCWLQHGQRILVRNSIRRTA